jgi:elongation factor P
MAIDTSQFRNGLKVEIDGEPYNMIFFQHVKPGKGGAFVRTKLKNLRNGKVVERTFRSGERLDEADVQDRRMSYLYQDSTGLVFMDSETASGSTKPATIETGAVVQVPLFVKEGEKIRVDTRTGEYVERVNR